MFLYGVMLFYVILQLHVLNLIQAKAVFDFESGGPGELSFSTDELLTIVRQVCDIVIWPLNLFIITVSLHIKRFV